MEDFFDSIYYWTNSLYSVELDNFLYNTPGYAHIGIFMLFTTFVISAVFYYMFKPVTKQTFWWFIFGLINAVINFCYVLWYTMTPLINNEVAEEDEWTYLDCTFMGVANIIWACIFFVVAALLIKWWSPAKYVPFRNF